MCRLVVVPTAISPATLRREAVERRSAAAATASAGARPCLGARRGFAATLADGRFSMTARLEERERRQAGATGEQRLAV